MMGSGKSTVGRELARLSDRSFADTDAILQARFGRPIDKVFALYGEDAFRRHETSVLKSLQPGAQVLATGGGIVLREENWVEMRRLGLVIFIEVPFEVLAGRLDISKRKRPLLQVEDWRRRLESLYEQRLPLYRRADVVVPYGGGDLAAEAARVREALGDVR